jgi:hypothetical protein
MMQSQLVGLPHELKKGKASLRLPTVKSSFLRCIQDGKRHRMNRMNWMAGAFAWRRQMIWKNTSLLLVHPVAKNYRPTKVLTYKNIKE